MGELDLPRQFDLKAQTLLVAVAQGRNAHGAGNIKASGAPLEEGLRQLLVESLPSTFKVASGYFYGATSRCSGEIDILVYEDQEAFRLDPAPQDQHYVPYTSVSIMGQVKNAARDLLGAIEQVQKSLNIWKEMRQELVDVAIVSGQPYQFNPLTFVVCGTSTDSDIEKLAENLRNKGKPWVDYILLLDRGLIIAGNNAIADYEDQDLIGFWQYRNANALHLCKPDGSPDHQKGVALMWFYFALVSKLNIDGGNRLRYGQFCRQIAELYPLRPTKRLA